MRRVLLAMGLFIPACLFARDHKLDTSQRAQQEALQLVLPATKAQFRQMQRGYRRTTSAFGKTDLGSCVKE